MADRAAAGSWVEIRDVVLQPRQRAPQVPDDTRRVPLEMRIKGVLLDPGVIGDRVEIVTPAGRRVSGVLTEVNPAYRHAFGEPLAELLAIGAEVRSILRRRQR